MRLAVSRAYMTSALFMSSMMLTANSLSAGGAVCGAWQGLGSATSVQTLAAIEHDGSLYIGGNFNGIAGQSTRGIARWDGSAWHTLGAGVSSGNYIAALAVYNGEPIAAGWFTSISGVAANNIARWDGTQWHALGIGTQGTEPAVYALAVHNGELYVGGRFDSAGNVANTRYLARWNGSAWQAVGPANSVRGIAVYALASVGNLLFAGGAIWVQTPQGDAFSIAAWNGTQWSQLGGMLNNSVYALTVYNGQLIVGGQFHSISGAPLHAVARYDGQWHSLANGVDDGAYVDSATVYNNSLIIGGNFTSVSGLTAYSVARWNGAHWDALGNPSGLQNRIVNSLTTYNGELIAGGTMNFFPQPFSGVIRWSDCAPPPCPGDVNASGTVNVDDLLVVINGWGEVGSSPGDITGDNVVNIDDLLVVINNWGQCDKPL